MNEQVKAALSIINERRESAFITGKAGTGKSTLLRHYCTITEHSIAVVAPTGLAAINVRGQTIHSLFGFPPRFIDPKDVRRSQNVRALQSLDTLVVDEVSMVRADLMDGIDQALRLNRSCNRPFGGIQVVLFGDIFQLPPIVKENELKRFFEENHGSPFFFDAHVFRKSAEFGHIELLKVYRQSDGNFIRLLNEIREGEADASALCALNSQVGDPELAMRDDRFVTLTTTNQRANAINQRCLLEIDSPAISYQARVTGTFEESSFPTDELLTLKRGARVMLIRNDPEKRWVNGTLGVVHQMRHRSIAVRIEEEIVEITPERWENIKYEYDEVRKRVVPHVIGVFEQLPVRIAYAMTIHKSQGQTYERVCIDLGNGAFAHGQLYVALSRCKTLEGILLSQPVTIKDVIVDPRAQGYRHKFQDSILPPITAEA